MPGYNMADFTAVDPLGRRNTLHDRTWFGHVIKGHPDMAFKRPSVERAIASPERITFSLSDPDCRLFYGLAEPDGLMVTVVVNVTEGFVKTAYRSRQAKGVVEWER
jgi:hypothetical protein